jgi:hypothetical protein
VVEKLAGLVRDGEELDLVCDLQELDWAKCGRGCGGDGLVMVCWGGEVREVHGLESLRA